MDEGISLEPSGKGIVLTSSSSPRLVEYLKEWSAPVNDPSILLKDIEEIQAEVEKIKRESSRGK